MDKDSIPFTAVHRIEGQCAFCGNEFQSRVSLITIEDYFLFEGGVSKASDWNKEKSRRNPSSYKVCPPCAERVHEEKKNTRGY